MFLETNKIEFPEAAFISTECERITPPTILGWKREII
jgi:hypothetical protein